MKISTKGRYALRVMLDLAVHASGNFIPLKEIAQRQEISVKYLEQVVSILTKAGYIQSTRGKEGGYRLTRRAEEYTLGEILRAAEGSLAPVACLDPGEVPCSRYATCPTRPFWGEWNQMINRFVDSKTLQDLVNNYDLSNGNEYYI